MHVINLVVEDGGWPMGEIPRFKSEFHQWVDALVEEIE
jgi:hypothetical protein